MRARYLLGFAVAVGVSGTATAQVPVGTNRIFYPTPLMNARPAANPQPRQDVVQAANWTAPGAAAPITPATVMVELEAAPPDVNTTPPTTLPTLPQTAPAPVPQPAAPPPVVSTPLPRLAPANMSVPPLPCEPERTCAPVPSVWVRGEWLFWATSGQSLPPIATTANVGTSASVAGQLGNINTATLFGGDRGNNDFRNGFRLTGGFSLDDVGTWGVHGDFFFLGRSRDQFAVGSSGLPILARPYFNAIEGTPSAALVSYPGIQIGTLTATRQNTLIGGGVNVSRNLCCTPHNRLDLLVGYRYLGVTDEVIINDNTFSPINGAQSQSEDRFRTENHFHGGVIGLSGEHKYGFCFVSGQTSIALGNVTQITEISGASNPASTNGGSGLLTQSSNIGRYETNKFAVLPEVSVRVGAQVTSYCRAYVGYNFLYLSSVARAGDQIDLRVGNQPSNVPAYLGKTTDFWAQGVSLGVQLQY